MPVAIASTMRAASPVTVYLDTPEMDSPVRVCHLTLMLIIQTKTGNGGNYKALQLKGRPTSCHSSTDPLINIIIYKYSFYML